MDEQSTTPDVQEEVVEQPDTTTEQPDVQPVEAQEQITSPEAEVSQVEIEEDEDEFSYPNYQIPESQPLDFNNLAVGDDNLIDPNALAGAINQQMATIEERATLKAQQAYQEQRAEEKSWDKAYEKYPELKTNKDLRDLVHRARIGEVADLLSKTQDPNSVKLPTPGQVAEKFFKYSNAQKTEGFKQATENVKVQSSAYVETSSKSSDDSADAKTKAFQNINNPNKQVAKQARQDLLKSMIFGE